MQHILRRQDDLRAFGYRRFLVAPLISVKEMSVRIPIHRHFVGHQGIQGHHFTFAVADDLRIGVAPQEQVRHERFPEDERAHLRIRLIMQQQI